MGVVAGPGSFLRYSFDHCQALFLRATEPGHAGNNFDRQRQRAHRELVKADGYPGIDEIRIELENIAVIIDCIIAIPERRKVATLDCFLE